MSARAIIGVALLAGSGFILYELLNAQGNGADIVNKPTTVGQSFLDKLAAIESGGQPFVKAATSSASGLYQFTRATWLALGGKWGPIANKAFGGLTPTVAEQTARAAQLVAQNAAALGNAGIAATDQALYAAHFLGPYDAIRVLNAQTNDMLSSLLSAPVIAANPFLANLTVSGFMSWLNKKAG